MKLTAGRLRELLHYDPETGLFTWRHKTGSQSSGKQAGTPHKAYINIQVDSRQYKAHRLSFLYMTGELPPDEVDHINGIGTDNRWHNLRLADHFLNCQNRRRANRNNMSGLLGVQKHGNGYKAVIRKHGRNQYLGYFSTKEEAHAVYVNAKREFHRGGTL